MQDTINTLWTSEQVAERLAVSLDTVRRWRSLGTGPRYSRLGPDGCAVRYRQADVEMFIAETAVEPERS